MALAAATDHVDRVPTRIRSIHRYVWTTRLVDPNPLSKIGKRFWPKCFRVAYVYQLHRVVPLLFLTEHALDSLHVRRILLALRHAPSRRGFIAVLDSRPTCTSDRETHSDLHGRYRILASSLPTVRSQYLDRRLPKRY